MSDDIFKLDLDFGFDGGVGGQMDARVSDALTLIAMDKTDEALDLIEAVKRERGATALLRHVIALAVVRMGRVVPALRLLREAHQENPDAWEHTEVLASLTAHIGLRSEGIYFAKLSTALKPAYPEYDLVPRWMVSFGIAMMFAEENPLTDQGYALVQDGALDRAADAFVDALDLNREDIAAWRGLVEVNRLRHRSGESLRAAEALVEISEDAEDHLTLARAELATSRIENAWQSVNNALSIAGPDRDVARALPGLVRYEFTPPDGLARQLAEAWRALADIKPLEPKVSERPNDDTRFRVGVLSGSIHAGSDRAPILSTIEECIGRAADLHFYSNMSIEDAVANRLRRGAMRWRDISRVDDETVARIIMNDEVQVLIDLDGFGFTGRPGVIALRPAPVVLSAFAEPGATATGPALGEASMPGFADGDADAVVVDASLSTWPLYVKAVAETARPAIEGPARILIDGKGGRLSPGFLSILADAIRAGMVGTLTLRGDSLADGLATEMLSERFREAGLDLRTVVCHGAETELGALLADADILLDTAPLPSVEAAFLALRHGVPVLSAQPASAVNAAVVSLLRSLGLEDWVAPSAAAMATRLAELTADPMALRAQQTRVRAAVEQAASLETRIARGRAFADLFDDLLAQAAERS